MHVRFRWAGTQLDLFGDEKIITVLCLAVEQQAVARNGSAVGEGSLSANGEGYALRGTEEAQQQSDQPK